MERVDTSPLTIYQQYLDRGELAYQWSPTAGRAVFYPRVICPFTGSDRLEWPRHRLCDHRHPSARRRPV
jgi:uncharacterized OB-fold protein